MAESNAQRSRKREKPVLSCSFCRSRKLRCDRQAPCGACVRRGKATDCTFSASEQERTHAVDYRPHARRQQARQRVARLEDLVTEMRNQMQSTPSSTVAAAQPVPSSPGSMADDMGKLSLTDDQAVYTGSSHWVTILEDIQRLKDELAEDPAGDPIDSEYAHSINEPLEIIPSTSQSSVTRISLLNSGPSLSKEQILSAVPPRETADRHVSNFFEYFDMAPFILHRGKFMAEYVRFWESPASISVLWLGVLFGVMSISSFLAGHNQQETLGIQNSVAADNTVQTYRAMTIHCLVAGDYLRPRQYTIEALILHFAIDQILNVDGTVSNWVLMGVVVRLALRMGLHRDPSHWPSIQPLQAELRRRLWISLYQMDFFTSVQVGLSRIIKDAQCDTQPPSYLGSPDLSQDIGASQLGAADSDSTTIPTPPLFIVQRNGIVKVAAAIYDATEEQPGPSPGTLSALTAQLEAAINSVPVAFTYTTFEASIVDGPIITLHRVVLDILIQKTVYLLHRRSFVSHGSRENASSTDSGTFASQDKCIQAAMSILKHQERLGRETVPGGTLFDIRWKVAASLNHEVLQATMMLCFALSSFESTWSQRTVSHAATDKEIRDKITGALSQVKVQWEAKLELSTETQRALQTVTAVLQRNQKGLKSEGQARRQPLPFFGSVEPQLLSSSAIQDDAFDPMLAFPHPESFDFNMFDYGGSIAPSSIDPLLYDPSFEFDSAGNP